MVSRSPWRCAALVGVVIPFSRTPLCEIANIQKDGFVIIRMHIVYKWAAMLYYYHNDADITEESFGEDVDKRGLFWAMLINGMRRLLTR